MESRPVTLLPDPKPFNWNQEEYRKHIVHVCLTQGIYEGGRQRIERYDSGHPKYNWLIYHHESEPGYHYEYYEDLQGAVDDYIALNPLPNLEENAT